LVDFFVVVVDFLVAGAFVVDFLVVAAVDDVVVMDSFLLAHDVIKPKAARTATDVISDCFIGGWLTSVQNVQPA
jgi:ribosomal protein S2